MDNPGWILKCLSWPDYKIRFTIWLYSISWIALLILAVRAEVKEWRERRRRNETQSWPAGCWRHPA